MYVYYIFTELRTKFDLHVLIKNAEAINLVSINHSIMMEKHLNALLSVL